MERTPIVNVARIARRPMTPAEAAAAFLYAAAGAGVDLSGIEVPSGEAVSSDAEMSKGAATIGEFG